MSELEFKTIIKILAGFKICIEDTWESLTTQIKELKTGQTKKKPITDMQNQLIAITIIIHQVDEWNSNIEDKMMENNEDEKKREWKLSDH